MIEFKARRLEIEGLEDMDPVKLYLELPQGLGVCAGLVRGFTEEQDPKKQLVRFEFVVVRNWLEKKFEVGNE